MSTIMYIIAIDIHSLFLELLIYYVRYYYNYCIIKTGRVLKMSTIMYIVTIDIHSLFL